MRGAYTRGSLLHGCHTEYAESRLDCSPGRFFAANELKAMMAHMLLTYDFKLEVDGVRPKDLHFASARIPNTKAKILFRRR